MNNIVPAYLCPDLIMVLDFILGNKIANEKEYCIFKVFNKVTILPVENPIFVFSVGYISDSKELNLFLRSLLDL